MAAEVKLLHRPRGAGVVGSTWRRFLVEPSTRLLADKRIEEGYRMSEAPLAVVSHELWRSGEREFCVGCEVEDSISGSVTKSRKWRGNARPSRTGPSRMCRQEKAGWTFHLRRGIPGSD